MNIWFVEYEETHVPILPNREPSLPIVEENLHVIKSDHACRNGKNDKIEMERMMVLNNISP